MFENFIEKSTTISDMLKNKLTLKKISELGLDDSVDQIELYHSKEKNHKTNTYYRVVGGGGRGYAGMGNGLYLGRDKKALINFYDIEDDGLPVYKYVGEPKQLNLMDYEKIEKFEKDLIEKNIKIINSNEIGEYVMSLGYDGIQYYDPFATGEEFVLYNTSKLKKV